jgi:ribosomal protein S1
MARSVAQGTTRPTMDPSRPVRGGRPSSRKPEGEAPHDNIKMGTITAVRGGSVFVDLGGKSQGVCPMDQFPTITTPEGETRPDVTEGQEYEFVFKSYDNREGLVLLARKGAVQHGAWETLTPGDTVEATVTGVNKGGLELRIGSTRAFMPAGQVDIHFNPDLSVFLNQRMTAQVVTVDRTDHNIVLSRRAILEVAAEKDAERVWGELAVGQVREGTVRSVQPYGAFVDLGGVDGLLHVSAMSHTRVSDPNKIVKTGDKVQVMVLGVDREKNRVSLGLKQLSKDPWEETANQFPVGTVTTGTVKKLADFGAFVELAPGVEGLVHISQLATRRVNKVSEIVKEGDQVQVKVREIDLEKRRVSLSMADVERETRAAALPAATHGAAAPAAAAASAAKKPQRKTPLKGGLG